MSNEQQTQQNNQTTDLVKIEATPAVVSLNFDEVAKALDKDLERYQNVTVTEQTLPNDKKLATDLNKRAGEIKRARIDKAKELKKPIADFEEQMKTLEQKCLDVREKINDQVKEFERKKLALCSEQLDAWRTELRDSMEIEPVHYMAEFDDLIKLTSLTKGGALTKGAKESLEQRVKEELMLQQRTESRLVRLENECLKAGLDAPLTRENVEAFLYRDDAEYNQRLDSLIENENKRQEQARERYQQQQQREQGGEVKQPPAVEPEQVEEVQAGTHRINPLGSVNPELVERVETALTPQKQESVSTQVEAGKKAVTVRCDFTVNVNERVPEDKITDRLKQLLADAGINTLDSMAVINVVTGQQEEQPESSNEQQGVF